MKYKVKLPLLLLFLSLWISGLQAQNFRSGLRLGLNASQVDGDHMGGYRKAGPVAGLYVNYPFSKKWAGQFEMLYSQKGSKRQFSVTTGGGPGDWNKLTLHYVEVPVLVEYTMNKKLKVQAGLGAAYLFGAQLEDLLGLEAEADFFDKYEISSTFGGTYQVGDRLSLFARHTNSVFSIWKKDTPVLGNYKKYGFYSLVASFGVYYHFLPQR
jgi:hypothetical protein